MVTEFVEEVVLKRLFLWVLAWVTLSISVARAAPYEIRHLEPMSWWVGMKHPELQLMVHAEGIAELIPALTYPGVSLISVQRSDSKNYLFINLMIDPRTKPGSFEIRFNRAGKTITRATYQLAARRKNSAARRGFDSGDAVYLIVPDRFANGDPKNDVQAEMPDSTDRGDPNARHGGDIRGMMDHLDYIKRLGFTMVWPTPLLENNQKRYSYHGYALTDYYQIDRRFGSNQDYKDYVTAANQLGLGVIQDIVVNHIGTGHWWLKDMPAKDWLNYPEARLLTNNQHTTVQDIHAAPEERRRFLDGWFVDSMPDMNQRNPLVARYLIQNTVWWIEYANLSGIREDTFSYAEPQFLARWSNHVLDEYPHLNIVGEEMNPNPHIVAYWQKGVKNRDGYRSGLPSLMDFPVSDLMPEVLNGEENDSSGWIKLYEMLANDFVYANPLNLMVFPDNHDRSRLYSLLHENLDLFKTALLFTATTRGIPQMLYGTEVLASSPIVRTDGLLRGDFPGGWQGDAVNAFSGLGLTARQAEVQAYVEKLFNWRKTNSAVMRGKLTHYIPQRGVYVYFRHDEKNTVMVVLNKSRQDMDLDLGRFTRFLGTTTKGQNVLTDETVTLQAPLKLQAGKSVAIAF